MTLRPLRAIREINQTLTELELADRRAEEEARLELAQSASRYSKRTKEVVDSTMSLSAVLMRAGEVEDANRLLAEIENDVMSEKVVLLESVEEVKAAKSSRHQRMTRLRLARLLATAFLGGSLIMFSAVGVAVAKYFSENDKGIVTNSSAEEARREITDSRPLSIHQTRVFLASIAGVEIKLSREQFTELKRLAAKDDPGLRDFLMSVLPADLAKKVQAALTSTALASTIDEAEATASDAVQRVRKTVKAQAPAPGSSSEASSSSSSSGSGSSSEGKKQSGGSNENEGDPAGEDPGCEDEAEQSDDERAAIGPVNTHCLPLIGGKDDGEGSG